MWLRFASLKTMQGPWAWPIRLSAIAESVTIHTIGLPSFYAGALLTRLNRCSFGVRSVQAGADSSTDLLISLLAITNSLVCSILVDLTITEQHLSECILSSCRRRVLDDFGLVFRIWSVRSERWWYMFSQFSWPVQCHLMMSKCQRAVGGCALKCEFASCDDSLELVFLMSAEHLCRTMSSIFVRLASDDPYVYLISAVPSLL